MKVFAFGAIAIALAIATPAARAEVSASEGDRPIRSELERVEDNLENLDDRVDALEAEDESADENTPESVSESSDRTGSFQGADSGHQVSGTVEVYEADGTTYIEIDEDFETTPGPDLVVILYAESEVPRAIDEEDYVTIAELKEFPIGEAIALDEEIEAGDYDSVAIWCRAFNVTFGFASLE